MAYPLLLIYSFYSAVFIRNDQAALRFSAATAPQEDWREPVGLPAGAVQYNTGQSWTPRSRSSCLLDFSLRWPPYVPVMFRRRGSVLRIYTGLGKYLLYWTALLGFSQLLLSLNVRAVPSDGRTGTGKAQASCHEPSLHHPQSCESRLGPKSEGDRRFRLFQPGRILRFMLLLCLQFAPVTGVRVAASPMGAAEAAPPRTLPTSDDYAAKQHGYQISRHGDVRTRVGKRSFRRACARAQRSQQGGTWYRGRWLTARALQHNVRNIGSSSTQPARNPSNHPARSKLSSLQPARGSSSRQRIHTLTWNCGGLSTGLMDEFLLFLQEHQPHVNVVCLQETHWKHTSEWLTERWICVHDHDPKHTYAGLLTLISRKLVSSEDVRTVSHVPGRVLQVRFPLAGVHVDILNCYQLPWNTRGCRQQLLERRAKIWNAVEQAVESVPQRNLLCVMGDFNAQLVPEANRVGTATCITDHTEQVAQDGPAFQGILQACNLVAVNTYIGPRRAMHTYSHGSAKTQIDYVTF